MNLQLFLSIILYFNIFYPSIQTLATETIQKTSIPHLLNETNHNSLDFIRNLEETSDKKAEDAHLITLNLYGNISMGYYFIELFFGSNLQKQSLIVGTGNTLTAVPCQSTFYFI